MQHVSTKCVCVLNTISFEPVSDVIAMHRWLLPFPPLAARVILSLKQDMNKYWNVDRKTLKPSEYYISYYVLFTAQEFRIGNQTSIYLLFLFVLRFNSLQQITLAANVLNLEPGSREAHGDDITRQWVIKRNRRSKPRSQRLKLQRRIRRRESQKSKFLKLAYVAFFSFSNN